MALNSDIESIDWHGLKNQAETLKKIIRPMLKHLYITSFAKLQNWQPDFHEGEQLLVIADEFLLNIHEFNSKLKDPMLDSKIATLANLHCDYMNNRAKIQANSERIGDLLKASKVIKNNILDLLVDLEKFLLDFISKCEANIEKIHDLSSIKNLISEFRNKTHTFYHSLLKSLVTLNAGALVALLSYLSQSKVNAPIAKHALTVFGNNLILLLFIMAGITLTSAFRGKFLQEEHDKYKKGLNEQTYVWKFKTIKCIFEILSILLIISLIYFTYGVFYSYQLLN